MKRFLEVELDHLDREVSIPNSQASYEYVAERLDRLDRKLMSLALPSSLTSRLNKICDRKRIVRDAFFNRVFLLLAAEPEVIDTLLFGDIGDQWRTEVWSENKNNGPFFQNGFYPLEPVIDPFWAVRDGLELYANEGELEDYIEPTRGERITVKRGLLGEAMPKDSLYTIIFDQQVRDVDLLGLNCYMPDSRIPGQKAHEEHRAKLDALLAELKALP